MANLRKRYGPYLSGPGYLFWYDVFDDGSARSVYAHREVMEKSVGRPLLKSEVVHHIDHNPLNNDLSNLKIMTQSEHMMLHNQVERLRLICCWCGNSFLRIPSHERHISKKRKSGPFCSKSCVGKCWRAKQMSEGFRPR